MQLYKVLSALSTLSASPVELHALAHFICMKFFLYLVVGACVVFTVLHVSCMATARVRSAVVRRAVHVIRFVERNGVHRGLGSDEKFFLKRLHVERW